MGRVIHKPECPLASDPGLMLACSCPVGPSAVESLRARVAELEAMSAADEARIADAVSALGESNRESISTREQLMEMEQRAAKLQAEAAERERAWQAATGASTPGDARRMLENAQAEVERITVRLSVATTRIGSQERQISIQAERLQAAVDALAESERKRADLLKEHEALKETLEHEQRQLHAAWNELNALKPPAF